MDNEIKDHLKKLSWEKLTKLLHMPVTELVDIIQQAAAERLSSHTRDIELSPVTKATVLEFLKRDSYINAIKWLRNETDMNLKEAKAAVDSLKEQNIPK